MLSTVAIDFIITLHKTHTSYDGVQHMQPSYLHIIYLILKPCTSSSFFQCLHSLRTKNNRCFTKLSYLRGNLFLDYNLLSAEPRIGHCFCSSMEAKERAFKCFYGSIFPIIFYRRGRKDMRTLREA